MISERKIQKMVIKHLESNGWEFIKLNSLEDIKTNFRSILNLRNQKNLQNLRKTQLSDREFERYMSIIENNRSFSDYARFFMDDDNQIETDERQALYLNIFNKKQWCNNTFQVAEEVSNNGQRHDLLLMINGLPIANIELKKNNVSINNAFIQTKEYSRNLRSLLKFVQIFIISNENETRYYANNESINRKFVFKYSDLQNRPIDNIFKFIDNFLEVCTFSKYIARYVINKEETKSLIALRGYQVHGAEAAINHLITTNKNGYLWHATGSGKTITSFKVAQIVSREIKQFDKVVFLVDRKDLDSQTIKEYNSFLENHNKIEETKNSSTLLKQLKSSSQSDKLIISTIQKMNNLLTSEQEDIVEQMKTVTSKKFVFIIDECHRSQFGEMNSNIRDKIKDIRYIGFTGTPIFQGDKEEQLVTNDIFHVNIHKYLMQNAIEDGNVLPFYAHYYNNDEKIDEKEITKFISSEAHLKNIADEIIRYHNKRSINRRYVAMVALDSIGTLVNFYNILKTKQSLLKEKNPAYKPINVAGTFSYVGGYQEEVINHGHALKVMINDFNKKTNSNESIDKIDNYQNRLQSIIKINNRDPQIDIVLVVDQLLTGFDAKRINTIHVIKNLKRHALIQAISRTNRVFLEDKERGQVISYVPNFKEKVDAAIKMYSDSSNVDHIVKRDYDSFLTEAAKTYEILTQVNIEELLENPSKNIDEAKVFIKRVNMLSDYYKVIRTVDTFDDSKIGSNFSLDELNRYIKQAKTIKEVYKKTDEWKDLDSRDMENPFDEVDTPLYVDGVDTIDSTYIRMLLDEVISLKDKGNIKASKEILEDLKIKIEALPDSELLLEVIDELIEKFKDNEEIDIKQSLREIFNYRVMKFTSEYNISEEQVDQQIYYYKLKERYAVDVIEAWIKGSGKTSDLNVLERLKAKKLLTNDINKHLDLFRNKEEVLGE